MPVNKDLAGNVVHDFKNAKSIDDKKVENVFINQSEKVLINESENASGSVVGDGNPVSTTKKSTLPESSSEDDSEDSKEGKIKELKCGWGIFTPAFLQRFKTAEVFLAVCSCYAFTQGMVTSGLLSVVLSSIERRFKLSSVQSGIIAMGFDISSIICLVPVSFFGGLSHKPKCIATGCIIMGIGAFIFASPHFLAGPYFYDTISGDQVKLCGPTLEPVNCTSMAGSEFGRRIPSTGYLFIMFFASMIHGVGASPVYTLVVTYIDENTVKKHTAIYLAIYYIMALAGPACGYILGGQTLKYFVDVTSETTLTPSNHEWVGAWWVGFLIASVILFCTSIPVSAFPKELPDRAKIEFEKKIQRISMSEDFDPERGSRVLHAADIIDSIKVLLRNPTYGFINLCLAAEAALISGFVTFAPKFVESSFSIPASSAAQLIGVCTIPAGAVGIVTGGLLVKRFNLGGLSSLKVSLIMILLGLALAMMLLVRCHDQKYAGINHPYNKLFASSFSRTNLTSSCNSDCRCAHNDINPMCGPDSINYVSPCFAGCKDYLIYKGKKVFWNCSCIDAYPQTERIHPDYSGVEGKCRDKCRLIGLFMPSYSLIVCFTFMICTPILTATLRCVPENQKPLALGWQWVVSRILGMIPAPVIFGSIIDKTCMYWKYESCSSGSSCIFYTGEMMGLYFFFIVLFYKCLSLIFILCAYFSMQHMVSQSTIRRQ